VSRTLLIDGDTLVFAASSASEYEHEWSEWQWTLHANFNQAKAHFDSQLREITEGVPADRVIIALSASGQRFRNRIMPTYKANRKGSRKPVVYSPLREYVEEVHETFVRPELEGDDVLGILATHPTLVDPGERIIVSIDKDMLTIPGLHLNYDKARGSEDYAGCVRSVSVEEADRFHLTQTLTGDVTDGYPGCPGIGPTRAAKILEDERVLVPVHHEISRGPRKGTIETRWEPGEFGTPWEVVVSAYHAAGLGEAVALQNARVARILRHTDYDYEKKEVILWTP
jgi:5'-3' exonuclease